MTDLSSLIARLEKAEGPDREIDAHIRLALLVNNDAAYVAQSPFNGEWLVYAGERNGLPRLYENRNRSIPNDLWRGAYTSSIDAAVSLAERVLPGLSKIQPETYVGGEYHHCEIETEEGDFEAHNCPNAALAICLATLRALDQKGVSHE